MRSHHARRPRLLAAALSAAALLIGVAAAPAPASASPGGDVDPDGFWRHGVSQEADRAVDPAEAKRKLTDEVESRLAGGRGAPFWVRFPEEADLEAASKIADWAARGAAVRDALRAAAESAQASVIEELEAEGVSYTSFWVSNAVLVEGGDLSLALELASHREVSEIREVRTYSIEQPVESARATGTKGLDDGVAWGVAEIGAPEAWAQGITGEGIVVANIDTGVDAAHPALSGRFRGAQADGSVVLDHNWYDIAHVCLTGTICDRDIHGTHTMGTIVGDGGEGAHIGVAPGATWIAANGCANCTDTNVLLSGQWMLAPTNARDDWDSGDPALRPHIVNNSWGKPFDDPFYDDIVRAWEASGIFSSWSVGNSGPACSTAGSPGGRHVSYAVGAYDEDGEIGYFSSRGPGQDGEIKPDIAAPGVRVRSSVPGGGYLLETGTSMAAPHVAGAVALLWSAAPSLVGDIAATRALLDRTARDVDDRSCGGTAGDNAVWGEGKLDVPALIAAAPRGAAVLSGHVVDADGKALAGVDVTADGAFDRSTKTGEDGRFALTVAPGRYDVSFTSYGYGAHTRTVTVADGATATADARLTIVPRHAVSGTVTDASGHPVAGAAVAVGGPQPPGLTDAHGRYRLHGVPEGAHTLSVSADACLVPAQRSVTVRKDLRTDVELKTTSFSGGYTCASSDAAMRTGSTALDIDANGKAAVLDLPFAFPSFDHRYSTVYVSANGFLTFTPLDDVWDGPRPIPYPGGRVQGGIVAPFWALIDLDGDSSVRWKKTTVDAVPAVTIEWRNVAILFSPTQRLTFSATLVANGDVLFSYGEGIGADRERSGAYASAGLEAAGTEVAVDYLADGRLLSGPGQVRFTRTERAWIAGTVTDANDGAAVAGARVRVQHSDGTVSETSTSGDGTYEVAALTGRSRVTVTAPNYTEDARQIDAASWSQTIAYSPVLKTGVAEVSTSALSLSSDGRGNDWIEITVKNAGSAPLKTSFREMLRDPQVTAPQAGQPVEGVWSAMPASSAFGVGYDGRVWVSDWAEQRNGLFSVTGGNLGNAPHVAEMDGADRLDLAFDSRTGAMCQIVNGGDWSIHCFDRETGKQKRVITGLWADQHAYTALAHNPVEDVFYLGSPYIGTVLTVAGSTHAQPGKVVNACAVDEPALGFGYNVQSDTVWYSTPGEDASRLVQIDPSATSTCTTYRAVTTPLTPSGAAGVDVDEAGNVWAADMDTALVWRLNAEDPVFTDVPWLEPNQESATLKPGKSRTFKIKVRGSRAEIGAHAATLLVDTDAGRTSRTSLPVDYTRTSR